ncbi:hypothetical protein CLV51_1011442 [Chitinophaga niastensis]|uniref:Uncharacterized protein n=1 Tax=Chitinophaga niastensis TaxID=536980 RepID=A0A2P8HV78_CHINA|nr:hypothetical protein [Chitinophaga niastensis]PSL50098.1 hypothetical protein CLV51_1011442 [Chitinophaga niastensis]
MKPEKNISKPEPRIITVLKKMIEDKKVIHEHLSKGGKLSELEAKGFKFVKFL